MMTQVRSYRNFAIHTDRTEDTPLLLYRTFIGGPGVLVLRTSRLRASIVSDFSASHPPISKGCVTAPLLVVLTGGTWSILSLTLLKIKSMLRRTASPNSALRPTSPSSGSRTRNWKFHCSQTTRSSLLLPNHWLRCRVWKKDSFTVTEDVSAWGCLLIHASRASMRASTTRSTSASSTWACVGDKTAPPPLSVPAYLSLSRDGSNTHVCCVAQAHVNVDWMN